MGPVEQDGETAHARSHPRARLSSEILDPSRERAADRYSSVGARTITVGDLAATRRGRESILCHAPSHALSLSRPPSHKLESTRRTPAGRLLPMLLSSRWAALFPLFLNNWRFGRGPQWCWDLVYRKEGGEGSVFFFWGWS